MFLVPVGLRVCGVPICFILLHLPDINFQSSATLKKKTVLTTMAMIWNGVGREILSMH